MFQVFESVTMPVPNFLIRVAKESDIPTVLELIQLKAAFDGCPASVKATPEKLKDTLFSNNPLAQILLAEINSQAVGFASYLDPARGHPL